MNIEVGEYIRTNAGEIAKVIKIEQREKLEDKIYLDINSDDTMKYFIYNFEIKAHSKNIIDLIEVKDIIQIKRGLYDDYNFIFICSDEDIITAKETIEEYAIRILTHEQFEQNSYKIGV